MAESNALARQQGTLAPLAPIYSPQQVFDAQNAIYAYVREGLQEGVDYGKIPGTGDKPALLKPGAERLVQGMGVRTAFVIVEQEIDHDRENTFCDRYNNVRTSYGLYRYTVRCEVYDAAGNLRGEGIGSASTLESKYISRPRDCENTVLKMAKKRALVDAVLNTFGLSDRFTQDVEDIATNREADANGNPAPQVHPFEAFVSRGGTKAALDRIKAAAKTVGQNAAEDIGRMLDAKDEEEQPFDAATIEKVLIRRYGEIAEEKGEVAGEVVPS